VKQKYITILLVPENANTVKRYQLSSMVIKCVASMIAGLTISFFILLYAYISMEISKTEMRNSLERLYLSNRQLHDTNKNQEVALGKFEKNILGFEKQVKDLLDYNTKIQWLLGTSKDEANQHGRLAKADKGKARSERHASHRSMGGVEEAPKGTLSREGSEALVAEDELVEEVPEDEAANAQESTKTTTIMGIFDRKIHDLQHNTTSLLESFENLETFLTDQKTIRDSRPTIAPVTGWITSGYGRRKSPFTNEMVVHKGIDIAADIGTEVVAPAEGIVYKTGYHQTYGKSIFVQHNNGIETRYCHLSKILVRKGQKIKRYQEIGRVGNTGRSTGPHLHYEVRIGGIPVNPKRYITE
jgi:murein DD-endopeptidase MepM/ murein hydrolase activator NlpD